MLHFKGWQRRPPTSKHFLLLITRSFQVSSSVYRAPNKKRKNFIKEDVLKKEKFLKHYNKLKDHEDEGETFYDPGNTSLDLSLPNDVLLKKIVGEARSRMDKRFFKPSDEWLREYIELALDRYGKDVKALTTEFSNSIENSTISLTKLNDSIGLGDIVTLENEVSRVYLIVAIPENLEDDSFTFINNEGEILYGPKSLIKVRIPSVIPEDLAEVVRALVQKETKHLDTAPIGVPDSGFTRSREALPEELRQSYTPGSEQESSHVSSAEGGSDFLVSSASAQLLKNSDVNTYIVSLKARELISGPLSNLSITTFNELPLILSKLEILHKVLQYNEDGDLLDSPRTFSIFQILSYLDQIPSVNLNNESTKNRLNFYKSLQKNFSNLFKTQFHKTASLGKPFPKMEEIKGENAYKNSTFFALILALKYQGRQWKLLQQNSTKVPTGVVLLPMSNVKILERTIHFLNFYGGRDIFTKYVIKKLKRESNVTLPKYYDSIIRLFKDYISDNFSNDPVSESAIVNLIRSIDEELIKEGFQKNNEISRSYEYSKTRAFEILQMMELVFKKESFGWENPSNWSYALQLPHNNTSLLSDYGLDYYNILDSHFKNGENLYKQLQPGIQDLRDQEIPKLNEYSNDLRSDIKSDVRFMQDFYKEDPFKSIRSDFGDIPVYCIDSETAHEIDDGISIHEQYDKYVITIHVANPTSYIKPFSNLSKIAFSKGSTTYLPEGPSMMFPKIISEMVGLGQFKEGSRTFAVQYKLDKELFDEYIKNYNQDETFKPNKEFSQRVLKQIEDSSDIKLYQVKNFPPNYTYTKVNEILNDFENIRNFKDGKVGDQHVDNLFKLHRLSNIIRDIRISIGGGIDINSSNSSVRVEFTEEEGEKFINNEDEYIIKVPWKDGKSPVIKINSNESQSSESKSQSLVSQLMISGNYSSSVYAKKHKIAIIHRGQEIKVDDKVLLLINKMVSEKYSLGQGFNLKEISQILQILNNATFQIDAKSHNSIGLTSYSTITSPLRRFVDMINHWRLEQELMKTSQSQEIKEYHLKFIGNHLQMREIINKKFEKFLDKFWQSIFLQEYFKLGQVSKPIRFKILLKSNPNFGDVRVEIVKFESLRAKFESSPSLIKDYQLGKIKVGSIIEHELEISKLDFIEDELVLKYEPCK